MCCSSAATVPTSERRPRRQCRGGRLPRRAVPPGGAGRRRMSVAAPPRPPAHWDQPRRCQPLHSLLRMPRGPAARPGLGFGIRLAERRKRGTRGAQLLGTESNGYQCDASTFKFDQDSVLLT